MNDFRLTPEQIFYLRDRGFHLIYRQPSENARYPYISLGSKKIPNCAVYHLRQGVQAICAISSPFIPIAEAVARLEKTVVSVMSLEGRTISTKRGIPIDVYAAENVWKQIARELARKYPAKRH